MIRQYKNFSEYKLLKSIVLLVAVSILAIPSLVHTQNSYPSEAVVKRVVDGDTIKLENGERVRYIGVDTPETKHPYKKVQYFGKEASVFNTKLVEGKKIRLEYDVEKRDKYGRLLAYVYIDDIFVNAELVKQGYARVMTIRPNTRYAEYFKKLQDQAKEEKKGLWAKK